MPWKKGVSGNPHGRAISIAQKLIDSGVNPSENVYVPILDKRDPAKELIKLADNCPDKQFKKEIWMFLFAMKYKAVRIMSKPAIVVKEPEMSDADMISQLEGKTGLESNSSAPSVKP